MKQSLRLSLFVCCLWGAVATQAQTPFTPGNIVVYRTGDGTLGTLDYNGFPVYLDEFTPAGVLVRSIKMPTVGLAGSDTTNRLVMRGVSGGNFQGQLSVSTNRQYLMVTGFDAAVGTESVSASVNPRSIGRVKYDGTINTTTAVTATHNANGLSAAVSTDGNAIWVTGVGIINDGVRYTTLGATTTERLNTDEPLTSRSLGIYDGQLYAASHNSYAPSLSKIGTGLPTTTGQTVTTVIPGQEDNPITQFVMLDMDPGVAGVDVLYVTNPHTSQGGIHKYSLVGGVWTLNGKVGDPSQEYFGLAAQNNGGIVSIFATRNGTNSPSGANFVNGGELVSLTDASGYNGAFTGTPTSLSTIVGRFGANDVAMYRGVAFVPTAPPALKVALKAYLHGAYSTSSLRHRDNNTTWVNILRANALNQPFNTAPFNYTGTESVLAPAFDATAATTDKVDWVLVELRDATTPATVVARRAGFIREDGRIVDVDGTSDLSFPGIAAGNYHVVVRHRNHLAIRTASPLALNTSTATLYDFTTAQAQAYQSGSITTNAAMFSAGGGVFTLAAGDANRNGNVRYTGVPNDAGVILSKLGGNQGLAQTAQYDPSDLNLDGTVRYTGVNNDAGLILTTLGANQGAVYTQHQ